jgi:hypothetical protein
MSFYGATTMAKHKTRRSKPRKRIPLPPRREGDDYTIIEWAAKRRITESMFFKLQSLGLGPKVTRIGSRVTISEQADREWRPPSTDEIAAATKATKAAAAAAKSAA